MDLSGLPETAVDSEEDDDEEDIERASDPLMSRDIVRDCLEKDPMDRTDDDIGERLLQRLCTCIFSYIFKPMPIDIAFISNAIHFLTSIFVFKKQTKIPPVFVCSPVSSE